MHEEYAYACWILDPVIMGLLGCVQYLSPAHIVAISPATFYIIPCRRVELKQAKTVDEASLAAREIEVEELPKAYYLNKNDLCFVWMEKRF